MGYHLRWNGSGHLHEHLCRQGGQCRHYRLYPALQCRSAHLPSDDGRCIPASIHGSDRRVHRQARFQRQLSLVDLYRWLRCRGGNRCGVRFIRQHRRLWLDGLARFPGDPIGLSEDIRRALVGCLGHEAHQGWSAVVGDILWWDDHRPIGSGRRSCLRHTRGS